MGFRPRFTNPMGTFGQGIAEAARSVGSFFAKKADQEYQRGLTAISDAKAELARLDELESHPRLNLSAEEQASMNALREYYRTIENAHPVEAMQLSQEGPPGATTATKFSKNVVTARPGLDRVEAGTGRVTGEGGEREAGTGRGSQARPQPEMGVREQTRTEQVPAGQFVSSLAQRARLGEESREERMLAEERQFLLTRDRQGQDVQLEMQELEHAHGLMMLGKETEAQAYLEDLAHENNMDVEVLRGKIEEGLQAGRFEHEIALTDMNFLNQLALQRESAEDQQELRQADHQYNQELARLESELGIDRALIEADLQRKRDNQLFEQQKSLLGMEIDAAREAQGREFEHDTNMLQSTQEHELTVQERSQLHAVSEAALQRAHELGMQGNQSEYAQELVRLESQLGINASLLDAEIQRRRDMRLFDLGIREMSITDRLNEARSLSETVKDTSLPDATREAAADALSAIGDTLPAELRGAYADNVVQEYLQVRDEEARAMRQATLEDLEANNQLTREQANVLQSQVRVNDANIRLTNLQADAEQILNDRRSFENDIGRITAVNDYVERAVNSAMPDQIISLQEEVESPGTHPHLSSLAAQVTNPEELEGALDQAVAMEEIAGRQQDVALRELERGELTSRAEAVNTIGGAFDRDQIQQMANNGEFDRLIEEGVLTRADVSAMQSAASHRQAVEAMERDAPKLELFTQRLNSYAEMIPRTTEERTSLMNGVRSTTGKLVNMGYMSQDEANGIMAAYERLWSENITDIDRQRASQDLQDSLTRAQIGQARSAITLNNARAAAQGAEGGAPTLDPSALNAYSNLLSDNERNIRERAEQDGCAGGTENERILSDGVGESGRACVTYVHELEMVGRGFTDLSAQAGLIGEAQASDFDSDLELVAYLGTKPARSSNEEMLYQEAMNALIAIHGSEEAVIQEMERTFGGQPVEEAPEGGGGDGASVPFWQRDILSVGGNPFGEGAFVDVFPEPDENAGEPLLFTDRWLQQRRQAAQGGNGSAGGVSEQEALSDLDRLSEIARTGGGRNEIRSLAEKHGVEYSSSDSARDVRRRIANKLGF